MHNKYDKYLLKLLLVLDENKSWISFYFIQLSCLLKENAKQCYCHKLFATFPTLRHKFLIITVQISASTFRKRVSGYFSLRSAMTGSIIIEGGHLIQKNEGTMVIFLTIHCNHNTLL